MKYNLELKQNYPHQTFKQTQKSNNSMFEYLRLMKFNSDNLGQARSLVPTRALMSQVLLRLDEDYNVVVVTLQ